MGFKEKAHGCIFFCYAIVAQAAQLAISDSRSVLQEQRWNNQGQAVQVYEVEREKETYRPLPGTKENPIVQVDEGRNCYPTSFNDVALALLSEKPQKSTSWDLTFSPRSLREPAKSSKTHPPLPVVLEWTQWGFLLSLLASHSPCKYIWRGMLANHLGSSNHFVF